MVSTYQQYLHSSPNRSPLSSNPQTLASSNSDRMWLHCLSEQQPNSNSRKNETKGSDATDQRLQQVDFCRKQSKQQQTLASQGLYNPYNLLTLGHYPLSPNHNSNHVPLDHLHLDGGNVLERLGLEAKQLARRPSDRCLFPPRLCQTIQSPSQR